MCLPMLREIDISGYKISISVKSKLEADLIRLFFHPIHDEIEFLYFKNYKDQGWRGLFNYLLCLRALKSDIIIPSVGIAKMQYNILAFLSNNKFRVGHGGEFSFLNNFNWEKKDKQHKVVSNCEIFRQARKIIENKEAINNDKPIFPSFLLNDKMLSSLKKKYLIFSCYKVIGIAPGSGEVEAHKRWPIESYADLAINLLKLGYGVVFLGGPGEEFLGEQIAKHVQGENNFLDLTGQQSLSEVVHTISLLNKLVANCNGLSHLASVVDTPVVGIYGPTDPNYTGPYSENLKIVSLDLECSPCYNRDFLLGCGDPICMRNINVSEVMKNILID
jgi:heptosyltransferase-2